MGVLRAAADAVVVGAGTLRDGKGSPLSAASIYSPMKSAYASFRSALGKEETPLAVIVTSSGNLNPSLPLFHREQDVLVVTTPKGARSLRKLGLPSQVTVTESPAPSAHKEETIAAHSILDAIAQIRSCSLVLVEGGPHLSGRLPGRNPDRRAVPHPLPPANRPRQLEPRAPPGRGAHFRPRRPPLVQSQRSQAVRKSPLPALLLPT